MKAALAAESWVRYGIYCNTRAELGKVPLSFIEWSVIEQYLAGEQLTIDGDEVGDLADT